MPYRTQADDTPDDAAPATAEVLTTVDASGYAGRAGAHGGDGSHGSSAGADGRDGSDAGPAEPGQHAGSMHVVLRPDAHDAGNVLVAGSVTKASGEQRRLNRSVPLGDTGHIDLVARGGNGGNGGRGGNGGSGARGSSGSNATRYSSGGDGGPGGNGGDGGNGTSGARGGKGGAIVVEVATQDTHLLMLTRHAMNGGHGGAPGRNGLGGSGGAGGPGGSSYSWTETEHYTDAQGNSQTRTTFHSNSGGSSGRSGRNGRSGSAELLAGTHGQLGQFAIHVTSAEGTQVYPSRYDLRLVGFEHHSENRDGIYEPEEKIVVSKIEVENVGGMPTPASREIHLTLRDKGWIAADPGRLVLPASLLPGQRHVFASEELTCTLGAFHPSRPSDPLAEEEVLRHRAVVPDARREFTAYESPASADLGRFTVRFPLEATPIETLHSLAPGEAARIRFRITNVSERPFGTQSALGRAIAIRLFLHESELGADELLFFDEHGARVSLGEGFVRAIPHLGPGESLDFEGALAVPADAPCYRAGRIWMSLDLGAIGEPAKVRPIQYRAFDVRVGRPFSKDEQVDVLLAVNNRTTAEELAAWERLAASIGLSLGVFDLSIHGGIALGEGEAAGRPSLREQLEGRTLVVLNNAMDTARGARRPLQYVSKEELLRLADGGSNVMVLGEAPALEQLLVPTGEREEPSPELAPRVSSEDVYVRALAMRSAGEAMLVAGPPELIDVEKWSWLWWGKPTEEAIEERAIELQEELMIRRPDRRHVLVWDLAPEPRSSFLGVKRWRMGRIQVRRTLEPACARITAVGVSDAELHQGAYVASRANTLSLLLALPFEEKLRRLASLTQAPRGRLELTAGAGAGAEAEAGAEARAEAEAEAGAEAGAGAEAEAEAEAGADAEAGAGADAGVAAGVGEIEVGAMASSPTLSRDELAMLAADAILVDLANEQLAVLHRGWCAGASPRSIRKSLALLGQLTRTLFAHGEGSDVSDVSDVSDASDMSAERSAQLIRLIARLWFFSTSQVRLWELIPPLLFERRAPVLRGVTRGLLDELVARLFGGADPDAPEARARRKAAREAIDAAVKKLHERFARAKKEGEHTGDRASFARELLLRGIGREGVTTDAEVLRDARGRVLSRARYDELCEQDGKAADKRRRMMATAAKSRADLLRPESCAELLGVAAERASSSAVAVLDSGSGVITPEADGDFAIDDLPREEAGWVDSLQRDARS